MLEYVKAILVVPKFGNKMSESSSNEFINVKFTAKVWKAQENSHFNSVSK